MGLLRLPGSRAFAGMGSRGVSYGSTGPMYQKGSSLWAQHGHGTRCLEWMLLCYLRAGMHSLHLATIQTLRSKEATEVCARGGMALITSKLSTQSKYPRR